MQTGVVSSHALQCFPEEGKAAGRLGVAGIAMGESNPTAENRPRDSDVALTAKIAACAPLWQAKCGFSLKEKEDVAVYAGAAEPSIPKAANESVITEIVLLINF